MPNQLLDPPVQGKSRVAHPETGTLAHLAQLVARMPAWFSMIARQNEIDFAPKGGSKMPGYSIETTATLLAEFDENVLTARAALAEITDQQFDDRWTIKRAEEVLQRTTRYLMLRSTFNHLVHHRAQRGIYLRLSDIKVPSMYGPTADEGW